MTPGSPPPSIARCSAPSRSYVLASLRALHLDRACAPAVSWQLRRTSHHQDQLYAGLHTSRGSPSVRRATQRGLCHLSVLCSSARKEDIACAVWLLTARLLIRIAEAVWACVRSE
jgi:hypothetical protein